MARSEDLVFTLYGDYIRHRGGEAWTGSLIELLGPLGLSEQAVPDPMSGMDDGTSSSTPSPRRSVPYAIGYGRG